MKNSMIPVLIIIAVVLCNVIATDLWCQTLDKSQKTFEQYCIDYNGVLPETCNGLIVGEIDTDDVLHLIIGGCDQNLVAKAIKTYDSIRTLDISHSTFTSLDWLDLRLHRLERFNASYNEIAAIPAWFFKNARRTIEIDLSHNKLTAIDCEAFEEAKILSKIHLAHNQLHVNGNESKSFGVARRLQYLDLSANRYWDVPILSKNKHLTEIHLEENPIRNFTCRYMDAMNEGDDESDGLSVYVSWKSITSFAGDQHCTGRKMRIIRDSAIQGMLITENGEHELHCGGDGQTFEMLRNFIAGNQSFENVTEILPCFGSALETINLSDNIVQKFDETTLKTFANLKQIVLRNTNLTEFNFNWFGYQTEINELDISENNLTQLANFELLNVQPWIKLRELNLAKNRLENTPEIMRNLKPMLQKLDLSDNFIGQLNITTLDTLTALTTINFANTNLSLANNTNQNPFNRLNRLSAIDISNNNLETVDVTVFASTLINLYEFRAANCRFKNATNVIVNLGSLTKSLDLSGNFLNLNGQLHEKTFEFFPYLNHLNLSNTNLTMFDNRTLQYQTVLRTLDLSWNRLSEIDVNGISSKLQLLNLHGNNLTKIENLSQTHFPRLRSVKISRNQLDCDYLVSQIKHDWKGIKFTDNPYDQQHEENCFLSYTINAIIIGVVLAIGAIVAIVSVFGPFFAGCLGCSK